MIWFRMLTDSEANHSSCIERWFKDVFLHVFSSFTLHYFLLHLVALDSKQLKNFCLFDLSVIDTRVDRLLQFQNLRSRS